MYFYSMSSGSSFHNPGDISGYMCHVHPDEGEALHLGKMADGVLKQRYSNDLG